MSNNLQETIRLYAQNLGVSPNVFKPAVRNPSNFDLFEQVQHNDLDGAQSRLFAACYQGVRNFAGPYKIFGSRQVQEVNLCVNKHVDAWLKTQSLL